MYVPHPHNEINMQFLEQHPLGKFFYRGSSRAAHPAVFHKQHSALTNFQEQGCLIKMSSQNNLIRMQNGWWYHKASTTEALLVVLQMYLEKAHIKGREGSCEKEDFRFLPFDKLIQKKLYLHVNLFT